MRTVYEVSLKILLRIKWLNVKGSFVFHFSYVLQLLRLLITRRLLRGKKCLEEWQSQRDNLSTGLKARKIPLLLSGKESQKESDAHFYRVCNQRNLDLRLLISTETNLAERRHRNVSKTVSLQLLQLSRLLKKKKERKKERKITRIKFLIFFESPVQNLRIKIKNKSLLSSLVLLKWRMKQKTFPRFSRFTRSFTRLSIHRPNIVSRRISIWQMHRRVQNRVTLSEKNHGSALTASSSCRDSGTAVVLPW